jgi:hypothetical protein
LAQPSGEGGRIEANRAADLETGNAIFGGEFINLAFGDIQEFGYIGDGEGLRPPVERVGEIHGVLTPQSSRQSVRTIGQIICPGFRACPRKTSVSVLM